MFPDCCCEESDWAAWRRWVRAESRRQFYEASGHCMRSEMSENMKAILAGEGRQPCTWFTHPFLL